MLPVAESSAKFVIVWRIAGTLTLHLPCLVALFLGTGAFWQNCYAIVGLRLVLCFGQR
jgi:hypothetical protein